jgi:hypothetical protein
MVDPVGARKTNLSLSDFFSDFLAEFDFHALFEKCDKNSSTVFVGC